ncbi:PucR family transcriptional regulator [Litchfieldia alkalitelluris]|uniref:PucR family transcriptional regulator n=1 Tax=Litchfieldia alkalitelluris TaxID=304268 RepID=UPI0009963EE0|nr:helix-turn-helix domain-containing protein [Litchfieldia alkalitelluris]
MINKLKKFYKDSMVIGMSDVVVEEYYWFSSDDGTTFGIEKNQVTNKEQELLTSLFHEVSFQENEMSEEQSAWYNFLFLNQETLPISQKKSNNCRFIHFHTDKPITDQRDFREAINAIFPYDVIILWENDYNGVLIDTHTEHLDDYLVSFEEITDTITSDFYVRIRFFLGQTYSFDLSVMNDFHWEKECFKKALSYLSKQTIFRLHEVIPYLIIEQSSSPLKQKVSTTVLRDLQEDKELLETIKVFLESNLNVSLAAKKLYMHRNSLQYRIDKFIEKTGIDIKHFQGAVTTYLAIMIHDQFSDS